MPDQDTTHRAAILVLPDFSHLTLSALIEPMRLVNKITRRPLYHWNILHTGDPMVRASNGVCLQADLDIAQTEMVDTLFVVASFNVMDHLTTPLTRYLRHAARSGTMICGVETGAYALAHAGILDGYRATVHWEDLDDFQERFPRVEVVPDRFIIDRKRGTTGGSLPALDLILDIITRAHGAALGLTVSGVLLYDDDRRAAAPQHPIASTRLARLDRKLALAIALMEKEIGGRLHVPDIAARAGLSTRSLQRRFLTQLGVSPARFFTELQLGLAYRLLEQTDRSVVDIAITCGFGSGSAFARSFKARYHRAPTSLRKA